MFFSVFGRPTSLPGSLTNIDGSRKIEPVELHPTT
jgi:hypothetical protein